MRKALTLIVGAVATALISVGVAAQTGTIHLPANSAPSGPGGVEAQQAVASPTPPTPSASPSPSPQPSQAPAVVAPQPQGAPPGHKKKHGG